MMDISAIGPKELSCFIGAKELTDYETDDGRTSTSLVSCLHVSGYLQLHIALPSKTWIAATVAKECAKQTGSWACVVMMTRLDREHRYVYRLCYAEYSWKSACIPQLSWVEK